MTSSGAGAGSQKRETGGRGTKTHRYPKAKGPRHADGRKGKAAARGPHLKRGQGLEGAARHARQRERVVAGRAGPAVAEDDASRSVRPWLGSGTGRAAPRAASASASASASAAHDAVERKDTWGRGGLHRRAVVASIPCAHAGARLSSQSRRAPLTDRQLERTLSRGETCCCRKIHAPLADKGSLSIGRWTPWCGEVRADGRERWAEFLAFRSDRRTAHAMIIRCQLIGVTTLLSKPKIAVYTEAKVVQVQLSLRLML